MREEKTLFIDQLSVDQAASALWEEEEPGGNAFEATNIEVCLEPPFNSIRKPIDLALQSRSAAGARRTLPGKILGENRGFKKTSVN